MEKNVAVIYVHNPYLPEIVENIFLTLSFMGTVEEKGETERFL